MDKSTQTDENTKFSDVLWTTETTPQIDINIEKHFRHRWQKSQRGGECSVSVQTQSPAHGTASPVLIPIQGCSQNQIRPMRGSVEGLNQEIEKLVLCPNQCHTNRDEFGLFPRGTPEGHRAPVAELFYTDMRSVNTQTPIGDILSSDESHSCSPEDGSQIPNASPRINRFLAREPPDGCEKVLMKLNEADQGTTTVFKPCVGFPLRVSQGSAFQAIFSNGKEGLTKCYDDK